MKPRADASTNAAADAVSGLHDPDYPADPFPVWRQLRDHCPVAHDPADGVYVVSRHDDVRSAFLGERDELSNSLYRRTLGQVFGPNLLQLDGEEHLRRRRLVAPLLVGTRLASYVPVVEDVARSIIEGFASRGHVDVVEEVAHVLPGAVILAIMGLPRADQPQLFEWYEAMMAGLWDDPVARERGRQAHRAFSAYLEPIVARRREEPGDDLISRLVTSALEPVEVPSFASLLLTAGGETTDKAIGNLWFHLLTEPEALAAVQDDPALLDAAFTETMRVSPSLVYLGREAAVDFEWHGTTIPAGSPVRLCVGSANHDERVFEEPERFRLDRPDLHLGRERRSAPAEAGRSSHLAFGAGAHFCLGYELARLEVVTVTRMMLEVMRDPVLTEPAAPIVTGPSRSVKRLPVRFTPV
jgi:cytochrome P450